VFGTLHYTEAAVEASSANIFYSPDNISIDQGILRKMYAVIFRAKIAGLDEEYSRVAERMKELALGEYGCTEFVSVTQGSEEIAISYWENEDQIRKWRSNSEHLLAQELGRSKWYASYTVQVVEVIREYASKK
jgi:heme-degrading monooxygenase HmoA